MEDGPTSTYVYAIDLVDGQGNVRHFNEYNHKDVITACKVHLGMCGIIYKTTVKVVPDRVFKFGISEIKVSDLLLNQKNRKDFVMRNYGLFTMWLVFSGASAQEIQARESDPLRRPPDSWNPANDLVRVWTMNPVKNDSITPDKVSFEDSFQLKDGTVINGTADYRMASETIIFPAWTGTDVHLRSNVAWATPESKDFSASQKTIENFFDVYETAIKRLGLYTDSFGFFRWISHKDDCTLCQTKVADDDFRLILELELAPSCRPCNDHLLDEQTRDKVWSSTVGVGVMSNNSRILPHWGKYYDYIPGMIDHLRQNYGTNFDDFIKIRNEADLDPDNMFTNSHLRTLFHEAIVRNAEMKTCSSVEQVNTMAKKLKKLLDDMDLETCNA